MPPHRFARALCLLLQSHQYTADLRCDLWDFAVEVEELRSTGLTNSDLRWMLAKGLVLQALEVQPLEGQRRAFSPTPAFVLDPKSCFVLTSEGVKFTQSEVSEPQAEEPAAFGRDGIVRLPGRDGPPDGCPVWDAARRLLRFREQTIKQFKVPAPNQETILAVFQEEGWPARIDDPLPLVPCIEPKRRLHDTVNSLNRNQREPLLRFTGDGNGEGVRWEACPIISRHVNGAFH